MKQATQQKFRVFLKDLVKEYGEGAIITRQQVVSAHSKNVSIYPFAGSLMLNPDFKCGRGKFLITLKDNVVAQRDAILEESQQVDDQKKKKMLPENIRNSVSALAKIMSDGEDFISQEEIDSAFGGNDINDILKVL